MVLSVAAAEEEAVSVAETELRTDALGDAVLACETPELTVEEGRKLDPTGVLAVGNEAMIKLPDGEDDEACVADTAV